MSNTFILIFMLFLHIIDDFVIQTNSPLASMKQKDNWEDAEDTIYEDDYQMGLVMHSLSWSFMIMLPIAINFQFDVGFKFLFFYFLNAIVHGFIDDAKCNAYEINLIEDQTMHIGQILFTSLVFLR